MIVWVVIPSDEVAVTTEESRGPHLTEADIGPGSVKCRSLGFVVARSWNVIIMDL